MTPGARISAAIEVLDNIATGVPAEQALTRWARASRFAGSKDRAAVRDHVYDVMRRKRSLGDGDGRSLMLALARAERWDIAALFNGEGHAPQPPLAHEATIPEPDSIAAQCDLPEWLWPHWQDSLADKAQAAAQTGQQRAEVFLRVNLRKCGRAEAANMLADEGIATAPHPSAETCLRITENARRLRNCHAYQAGFVELQDASSQLAMQQLNVAYAQTILDYCAGGGGKALALADRFSGRIFAHDIDLSRLRDLPARAARAGTPITTLATHQLTSHAPFDLVLCDAPCSGSGTWRRTPEAKWRLTSERLSQLNEIQREVLENAQEYVSAGGVLAYATCSVLTCENEAIVSRFLGAHPAWQVQTTWRHLPDADGDGFFLAIMHRKTQL